MKLGELAKALGGELIGDENLVVTRISDIEEAKEGDLAFVFKKGSPSSLEVTKASCVVVPQTIAKTDRPIIRCKNPNLAFKKAVELILGYAIPHPKGVHKTASLGKNVTLGKDVALGAYACLEDDVEIGDGTIIYAHSYVGRSTKIGKGCIIYPNVTIRENIKIGSRVIIHPGSVIGSDGFGYEQTERGHEKIPQIGDVIIEDDVELGACVTVDRAKVAHTKIGMGTKVDNLVQIAHNVTIGRFCIIVSQCGISGSVKIGDKVMMGGQVGIAEHLEIGDNVMIAARAALINSAPPNTIMWGVPARPLTRGRKIYALVDKFPEIYQRLRAVEKKLGLGTAKDDK